MLLNPYRFQVGSEPVFPAISSYVFSSRSSATSHTLNVVGSAGERVVIVISVSAICAINIPADWNSLVYENSTSHTVRVIWKDLDATTNSVTVTTSVSVASASLAYKVAAGTFASAAPVAAGTVGNTSAPDSPSADYGSTKSLMVLSLCGYDNGPVVTTFPLAGDNASYVRTATPYCGVGGFSTTFSGQVYDPGAFTLSTTTTWVAATVLMAGP